MHLGQMRRLRQIALAHQRKHPCRSNIRYPIHEVVLAHELLGLSQNSDRAGHISLGKPQADEKDRIRREGVDAFYLPCQLEAVLRVLLRSIQVVPFVVDTGQAKMRFGGALCVHRGVPQ
ncbi:MAG: hypothetical protein M3069_11300 [Chloroflexota bacterium]|nr:hypothetical protein [Chloroflexota bacterium]